MTLPQTLNEYLYYEPQPIGVLSEKIKSLVLYGHEDNPCIPVRIYCDALVNMNQVLRWSMRSSLNSCVDDKLKSYGFPRKDL